MTTGDPGLGSQRTLQSIASAFTIVETLETRGPSGVTALAEELDIPKSTAHVYLQTLADLGYVVNDDGTYRVSLKFLERGGRVRQARRIYDAAKLEVDDLADSTNELANLGTIENGQRVLLYKSEGGDAVHDNTPVGEFTYLHWSSLGKAILAHLPAAEIEHIIDTHGLPQATSHTISSREALTADLERIRERGYALEDDERRLGMRAVAVPIMNDDNHPIASISVSGPKNRLGDDRIEAEIVDALESTANVIQLKYIHH